MTVADRLRDEGRIKGREEGRSEGREEGRSEGRREGRAALVVRQLALRFGELSRGQTERVQSADDATLDWWAERVLTARSLAEVLDTTPPPSSR